MMAGWQSHIPNAHQNQLSPTAHFTNDLGLDSLDTVEVVMAIEEVCGRPLAERGTSTEG